MTNTRIACDQTLVQIRSSFSLSPNFRTQYTVHLKSSIRVDDAGISGFQASHDVDLSSRARQLLSSHDDAWEMMLSHVNASGSLDHGALNHLFEALSMVRSSVIDHVTQCARLSCARTQQCSLVCLEQALEYKYIRLKKRHR